MKRIILIVSVLCWNTWADFDYGTALSNMVYALESPRATLDAAFTNRLASWAGETANACHVANVNLVRAISYTDIAEDELSGDVLLPEAILLCSNIIDSVNIPSNAWQRGAAGVVLSGINSFDRRHSIACAAATNSMLSTVNSASTAEDILLWNAIACHLQVEGLSVSEALRCYAAIALLSESPSSNIVSYTNALPETILVKIRELSEP